MDVGSNFDNLTKCCIFHTCIIYDIPVCVSFRMILITDDGELIKRFYDKNSYVIALVQVYSMSSLSIWYTANTCTVKCVGCIKRFQCPCI